MTFLSSRFASNAHVHVCTNVLLPTCLHVPYNRIKPFPPLKHAFLCVSYNVHAHHIRTQNVLNPWDPESQFLVLRVLMYKMGPSFTS